METLKTDTALLNLDDISLPCSDGFHSGIFPMQDVENLLPKSIRVVRLPKHKAGGQQSRESAHDRDR